jgi:AraC family transcriptional regulator
VGKSSEIISGKVEDSRIAKSREYIEENLSEVTLAEIAKKSGLSLRNFNRLFLQETGLGPKEFLILRRIDKSKILLKENKMTVTDISLEVGYNSLSKFIETFKKITGSLPSDFRTNVTRTPKK